MPTRPSSGTSSVVARVALPSGAPDAPPDICGQPPRRSRRLVVGAEPAQRDAELEHALGPLARAAIARGDLQELLGGVAIAGALQITLAEPIGGVGAEL